MKKPEPMVWRLYSALLGTVTTLAAQQVVSRAWQTATGELPPDPTDPEVPFSEAAAWVISIGVGVGVAQLSMNRHLRRRWLGATDHPTLSRQ